MECSFLWVKFAESATSCPALDEKEVEQRDEEWRRNKVWRQMFHDRHRPKSDRTENVLEVLEDQIKAMQSRPYSGAPG